MTLQRWRMRNPSEWSKIDASTPTIATRVASIANIKSIQWGDSMIRTRRHWTTSSANLPTRYQTRSPASQDRKNCIVGFGSSLLVSRSIGISAGIAGRLRPRAHCSASSTIGSGRIVQILSFPESRRISSSLCAFGAHGAHRRTSIAMVWSIGNTNRSRIVTPLDHTPTEKKKRRGLRRAPFTATSTYIPDCPEAFSTVSLFSTLKAPKTWPARSPATVLSIALSTEP